MADDSNNDTQRPMRKGQGPQRGPRLPRGLMGWLLVLLVAMVVVKLASDRVSGHAKPMTLYDLEGRWNDKLNSGAGGYEGIRSGKLEGNVLYLELETPAGQEPDQRRVELPEHAIDNERLQRLATIPSFTYDSGDRLLVTLLVNLGPLVLLFALIYFFFIRQLRAPGGAGSILSFGKSRARLASKEHTGVTFDDVAGIDEATEEVREVIEFLKNPEKFQRLGGRIPRGIMLIGAPGTGKTLLAKAIAGEADVPFFSICGSDFVEMFVGVGASRVRDLFRQAKENSPCIVFLDEIDAVGRRRGSGLGGGHDEREQTLNQILVEMDGFDTNQQVIVIASTNRPDVLDPALLRPGRFDREIVIDLPDVKGRLDILKVHARNVKVAEDASLEQLARGTPTFSGADLANIINEAALGATLEGKDAVDMDDLEEARDKVRWGRQKRSRVMDDRDRKVTAYHEAGHALVARLCGDVEPLHKVTIIPRGMSLGATMMLPERDRYTITRGQFLGQIKVAFAGRIAEEIFCGDISSGAASDIQHATEIARRMVCEFGMSDAIGPIRFTSNEQHIFLGGELVRPREHSEATAALLDREVKHIVDQCYQEAEQLIRGHFDETRRIAEALLKYEVLMLADVDRLLQGEELDRDPLAGGVKPAPVAV